MVQIRTRFLNSTWTFCSAKISHVTLTSWLQQLIWTSARKSSKKVCFPRLQWCKRKQNSVLPAQQKIILMLLSLHVINLVLFGHEQAHGKNQINDVQRKYYMPFLITTTLSKYIFLRTEYFRQYHWFNTFIKVGFGRFKTIFVYPQFLHHYTQQ